MTVKYSPKLKSFLIEGTDIVESIFLLQRTVEKELLFHDTKYINDNPETIFKKYRAFLKGEK